MSVLNRKELADSPLADLHQIASELGVEGYRAMRKDDLIGAILGVSGGGTRLAQIEHDLGDRIGLGRQLHQCVGDPEHQDRVLLDALEGDRNEDHDRGAPEGTGDRAADGAELARDVVLQCRHGGRGAEGNQCREQRVLDQVLALLFTNEAVEQIVHGCTRFPTRNRQPLRRRQLR